jgi:pyruvate-formate lyase-activating enzyme
MGAFAGSAALLCKELRSEISVVTLTMNNSCNLKCPHCYLQYSGDDKFVDRYVVDAIADSSVQAVSIVGMEPLKDRRSARELSLILDRVKLSGKRVGFVTNGLNARFLDPGVAREIDWIDVSVDGTEDTYSRIRFASVSKLKRGVSHLREIGVPVVNVLHTVHSANISDLAELAAFGRELASGIVMFSPYSATFHEGIQRGDLPISPDAFLTALSRSDCDLSDCWVVLDLDWLPEGTVREDFARRVQVLLAGRTILFRADPVRYGMIRITYDARVMTPRQAMHTSRYRALAKPSSESELRAILSQTNFAKAA